MSKDQKLTFFGHLAELRNRLIRMAIAIALTTGLSFVFATQIFQVLKRPVEGTELIFIDVTEMLGVYMKVCLATGVALAMPYIVYQLIMFIAPALTSREKKYVYLALPWIFLMFIGGMAFSYFVLIPPAMNFLLGFGSEIATPQIRIGSYISVVTRLIVATGVIFELPVISTFLARLGIITSAWLARMRKPAIVIAFILGAMITPTLDPINQSFVSLPLIALYEMSIWLARLVQRKQPKDVVSITTPTS